MSSEERVTSNAQEEQRSFQIKHLLGEVGRLLSDERVPEEVRRTLASDERVIRLSSQGGSDVG